METIVYRLALRGAFHQGVQGFAREGAGVTVPSDTLFAALVVAWADLGLDVDRMIAAFQDGETPLQVSSTFPYAGPVRFYPRPLLAHRTTGPGTPPTVEKGLRKVDWVSEQLFGALLRGEALDGEALVTAQQETLLLNAREAPLLPRAASDAGGNVCLWSGDVRPRVTLDRVAGASQIYHIGRMAYAPDCGLWFGAHTADPAWISALEQALDILSDTGLGGLRSIGHGAFTWSRWDGAGIPEVPVPSDYAITLSRYAPDGSAGVEALTAPGARYRLELVGGWSPGEAGARLRKRVRMVEPGSLLRADALHGRLVDVTPAIDDLGHRVYRYGWPFPVAVAAAALKEVGHA